MSKPITSDLSWAIQYWKGNSKDRDKMSPMAVACLDTLINNALCSKQQQLESIGDDVEFRKERTALCLEGFYIVLRKNDDGLTRQWFENYNTTIEKALKGALNAV